MNSREKEYEQMLNTEKEVVIRVNSFLWEGVNLFSKIMNKESDEFVNDAISYFIERLTNEMGIRTKEDAEMAMKELENDENNTNRT